MCRKQFESVAFSNIDVAAIQVALKSKIARLRLSRLILTFNLMNYNIINQHFSFDIPITYADNVFFHIWTASLIMSLCDFSAIKVWLIDVFHKILTSYIQSIVYMCTVFPYKKIRR